MLRWGRVHDTQMQTESLDDAVCFWMLLELVCAVILPTVCVTRREPSDLIIGSPSLERFWSPVAKEMWSYCSQLSQKSTIL